MLTTNDVALSAADIALGFKGPWIIESCFRWMQITGLKIRLNRPGFSGGPDF